VVRQAVGGWAAAQLPDTGSLDRDEATRPLSETHQAGCT
jgi:hypothetical protein